MKSTKTLLFASLIIFGITMGNAQNKKIETSKSTIEWVGKKFTGQHNGIINFESGVLIFKDKKLAGGDFIVDMTSLVNVDLSGEWKEKLEHHLKSDDFFGTENFKTAHLIFNKIAEKGNGVYTVTADLTIKGIKNSIVFDINISKNTAKAELKIDRTKYNIKFKSKSFFEGLGDNFIYDDFELTVNLHF